MRRQAVRTVALVLVALIAASAPARAATITFADVAQAVGANGQLRPASEVRLHLGAQSGAATTQNASAQSGGGTSSQQATTVAQQESSQTPTTAPASSDPTLSQSGGNVQTVDLGDVTGTVCDCGEIPPVHIPKGGFPWWTLAGIPIICVSGICTSNHHDTPECVVGCTPPPTPPPVPEPATLLLFGSGLLALGAGARRRYGRKQLEDEMLAAATEEV